MWHHIELLDAWCIENLGTETLIVPGLSDAMLPLNTDDASWDTSPFASSPPKAQTGFTDMTIALIQYEVAALFKSVLKHGAPKNGSGDESFLEFHTQLFQQSREKLEITYLKHLDKNDVKQRLARHIAELGLSQISLTQRRMTTKRPPPSDQGKRISEGEKKYDTWLITTKYLANNTLSRLFEESTEYCKRIQSLCREYDDHHFSWAVILQFSWHSMATMLSTVLRHHSLSDTPESRANRSRISRLFDDRPTIGYLSGNNCLWRLVSQLHSELNNLESLDQTKNQNHAILDSQFFDVMSYMSGQRFVDSLVPPGDDQQDVSAQFPWPTPSDSDRDGIR